MKRITVKAFFLLLTSVLCAQESAEFYRHELRVSLGEAAITSNLRDFDGENYTNVAFSYFFRPAKFFWVGINHANYLGVRTYEWREYNIDDNYRDFSKSNLVYCAFIAPEIRISCLNKRAVLLYGGFSAGVGIRTRYVREQKRTDTFSSAHITLLGISCNFGKNRNIFLGGELGFGFKGLGSLHGGYRF